jgi:lysophospholipase L1-like esterase
MLDMAQRLAALLLLCACISTATAAVTCTVCPAQDKCTVRVLALGDSLTRGAVPSTSSAHPYSQKMTEVLRNRLGSRSVNKANVQTTTAGEKQVHRYMVQP